MLVYSLADMLGSFIINSISDDSIKEYQGSDRASEGADPEGLCQYYG